MRKYIVVTFMALLLSGCTVNLPFNNRLSFAAIKVMKTEEPMDVKLHVIWEPASFPQRIDIQGSDGFVGSGTRTRIPTGIALSARIEEAISSFADLSVSGELLIITVLEARSGFEYSAGVFNLTPGIDVGTVTFNAMFTFREQSWNGVYISEKKDSTIGGTSQTAILESVWDDIAIQVAKDIANRIR